MAKADIEISLFGGETKGDLKQYQPGDEIRGELLITPQGNMQCNHLYVKLRWHTEGRGDRDEGIIATEDLFQGRLSGGMPRQYSFNFTLPQGPWSYAGHYINIIWGIAVEIDVPRSRDPNHEQPFVLAPG